MRAVVLFKANHVFNRKFAFEVAHVADFGATESVDRLVVVAHGENDCSSLSPPSRGKG